MKTKFKLFSTGFIALSLFAIGPKAVSAQQAGSQEPAPPPPPPAYAATSGSSPDGPPPPPPRRGRLPGPPPPPACGPDAPPPPAAAVSPTTPAITVRNTVRQLNYGPEGEVSGFLLANGTQVNLPPEVGEQFASLAKPKSDISITGYSRLTASGKTVIDATSITAGGQSIVIAAQPAGPRTAPPPPPPAQSEPPQN